MLKTTTAKAFFTLLRSGLWGKETDDLSPFPLSPEAWQQVYKLAMHHTVEGIIFAGLEKLPENFIPSKALFIQWSVRVTKIAQRNRQMNQVLKELNHLFTAQSLAPILLKGQGIARYYQNPEQRSSGDIDFYFPQKNAYQKANQLMASKGYKVVYTPGRSTFYYFKNIEIEHHQTALDIHNPFVHSYLQNLLQQQENHRDHLLLGDESVVGLLSPLLQSVQASTHILKHLLSFGIGIRQFCDVAMIYRHFGSSQDGEKLQAIYRKLHLYRWITEFHGVLIQYLGFPQEKLPFHTPGTEFTDCMMEDVWQAGNFGLADPRYPTQKTGVQTGKRLWVRFKKYRRYAPWEAFFFPFVHFYTKINK